MDLTYIFVYNKHGYEHIVHMLNRENVETKPWPLIREKPYDLFTKYKNQIGTMVRV